MITRIHPTALVDSRAEIDPTALIGPFAIVGPDVIIGPDTEVAARATIERHARVGRGCYIGIGSVVGGDPQDRKFRGERTLVEIGDETCVREYATINRGTAASGATRIGRRCLIMSYVHVAHDCHLADDVVLANAVQLAGHVEIGAHAQLGGSTPVHQFVRIGTHAYIGGGSRVPQDVPPYTKAAGNPLKLYGLNGVGLARAGFDPSVRLALKHVYRLLFNSDLTRTRAVDQLRGQDLIPEAAHFVDFVARSERGTLSAVPA
ncbi:MAG TPA: acyl-ACP--UDP-N-acetylglucosamine O-acyltransferase [Gemmatimonadales bacterium]|jgi:UDP-N-acetylglucosamine acyltransferase